MKTHKLEIQLPKPGELTKGLSMEEAHPNYAAKEKELQKANAKLETAKKALRRHPGKAVDPALERAAHNALIDRNAERDIAHAKLRQAVAERAEALRISAEAIAPVLAELKERELELAKCLRPGTHKTVGAGVEWPRPNSEENKFT